MVERSLFSRQPDAGARWDMRGFWALIVTQFQGAFNDNLFKFLIVYFLVALAQDSGGAVDRETAINQALSLATIIFAVPFIVFPGIFGALSDRFSKRQIAVSSKYLEVVIMGLATVAFVMKLPILLWFVLFCMATQSAFFSPAKYGILPEMLPESRLSWGNGVLAMGTMVAIVTGTGIAGYVFDKLGSRMYLSGVLLSVLSALGLLSSFFITRTPSANPQRRLDANPWNGMGRNLKILISDRWLLFSSIGYTYFWFVGALLIANVTKHGTITLGASATETGLMLACISLGIGVGSLGAGYWSRGKIELGLAPIGLFGMFLFGALLSLDWTSHQVTLWLLVGLGFSGGVLDVPLAATLQYRSPAIAKGGVLAAVNMLTFLGIVAAGGAFWMLSEWGLDSRMIFLATAIMSLLMMFYLCIFFPFFFVRMVLSLCAGIFYTARAQGREHVPQFGGALLLANHVSFADPPLIMAMLDRPVHFLMHRSYYNLWWLRPLAKMAGVIPVSSADGPQALYRSLQEARNALARGELVCLFPEGGISRSGELLGFQKGYERIIKGLDVPIIPVHLDNMYGSIFSYSGGGFFSHWPKRISDRVTISFGKPMAPTSTPCEVRWAIQELATAAFAERKLKPRLLHRAFVKSVWRHPRMMAIADGRSGTLSYFKTYIASIILARKMRALIGEQPMVGVMVPPSVGGALTNIALQIMGRVPINLNYTLSAQSMELCAQRCKITHCITAKAFLERIPVSVPGTPVYLEDIMKSVTGTDRIVALLLAVLCPVWLLERLLGARGGRSERDLATVIFSSGSEGEPKGALLTHSNIMKNIYAMVSVFPNRCGDTIMGILPFFHSYGFTGTLWTPLLSDMSVVFHPSPLEPKAIGELIHKYKATFFIATSTFIQSFIRRCSAEELSSLKYVICGAEKLTARVREAFLEKFGVEPIEGYGATECSPVISVNLPDIKYDRIHQVNTKYGAVGRPLPGLSLRVLDVESGTVLGENKPGLLQVKGASVMSGYLEMPEKTAAVLQDGWYVTGDIARVDEDGFIFITDRLARFSKIAGEMVPHNVVEEALHAYLGLTEQSLAVAGVKDAARGERLVVLHTLDDEQLNRLVTHLGDVKLPNLWRPRPSAFHRIEAIPCLGTGKMDIKAVRQLAEQLDVDAQA